MQLPAYAYPVFMNLCVYSYLLLHLLTEVLCTAKAEYERVNTVVFWLIQKALPTL